MASLTLIEAGPASAASNRLANGKKLTAGHCIVDRAGTSKEAKFCVGKYYNINLYYKRKICWSWQTKGHIAGPSAFVQVAKNGDVGFYQYSGGRRLWHSKTSKFRGAALVVGSHLYGKAILAVDTGKAFWTFKSCH
ncbi:hypothetical protein NE236_33995 [Actinoallomurus purpureus]|uniref:hypothetical protein n=1 Tax=Actinoallomurus purpureus TaxID=478114 RepID=UPI0020928A06|nr:hypothetical protein [Actinoallomurus purpureus]MCO6009995.1 hypothetical protein [Actinoallomurus purpureus]